ncbi:hypothetical protein LTR10_006136 [Elasticomyces elasticus]|nr:hypothetical protein LTR10_006136 [Elasticomyces elasticus]KAK4966813.1 hypothetical protein LTR42_011125 [Elasticomyces elasticus]
MYYFEQPYMTGLQLHLYTILPAGLLVVLQFTPVIRHTAILFHRLNGYLVIMLSLISSVGAIIILPHAFGGDFATQTFGGTMVVSTTIAYIMAYTNIKLLQIDQHRAWMIRGWAYFSVVVTIRLIQVIASLIISKMASNQWLVARPCKQINFILGPESTLQSYPDCAFYYNGTNPDQQVVVSAGFPNGNPAEIAAALGITFGGAGWLGLVIHAFFAELYLRLTPKESTRLRYVSYTRQLAKGMERPGYAGTVVEHFGDAEVYVPPSQFAQKGEEMGHADGAQDALSGQKD